MRNPFFILFFSINTLFSQAIYADNRAVTDTKTNLKKLETKIHQLQNSITQVHDKRTQLTRELAQSEKKISENVHKLQQIEQQINTKQQKINTLEQEINALNRLLHEQQHHLAEQIRARYQMGEYQPLKWLLNQEDPNTINRLMTYYQYFIQKNKQVLEGVQQTKHRLSQNQAILNQEMSELHGLQQQTQQVHQQLAQDKQHRTTLIHTLDKDIQSKQQTLETYRHNQANLSRLLLTLTQQSVIQTRHPFTQMRRKLHMPIATGKQNIQKINQGIVFLAPEGTAVRAVYPGKVVFCDWLNGYGLLLIIDHGWGFMTLYANNQALFKQKGETVNQGDQIATVGHSGGIKQNGLYFEIRHRGKATPPLEWLS